MKAHIDVFEEMKETACACLSHAEKGENMQAIVLLSATGKTYSSAQKALPEDEDALLASLEKGNDTEIRYLLCMWQAGACIDLPSYAFRQALCALNTKNSEALVFLQTLSGVTAKKLSVTMK